MAKKIGSVYWVHKSNTQELFDIIDKVDNGDTYYLNRIKNILRNNLNNPCGVKFDIVKYDVKQHRLSLIKSSNWDQNFEPFVDASHIWSLDNGDYRVIKPRKNNPQIYHQRYLFVSHDYNGFDVEADYQRRKYYEQFLTKDDVKKIGNYDYWKQFCEKYEIGL